jgi:tetratricopeptide (TPR) repeat protein
VTSLGGLPDLETLSVFDDRVRGVARDAEAVRRVIARASAELEEARRRGDRAGEQWLLGYLGNAARLLGEHDAAVARLRESLTLADALGDERRAVVALIRLGEAHRCAGEPRAAEPLLQDALARAEAAAPDLLDFALQHLGKALLDVGDTTRAREHLERALELRHAKGDAELIESTRAALRLVDATD